MIVVGDEDAPDVSAGVDAEGDGDALYSFASDNTAQLHISYAWVFTFEERQARTP